MFDLKKHFEMPDRGGGDNYLIMAAWKKMLECIRKISLTGKGLEGFGYVIGVERNGLSLMKLILCKTSKTMLGGARHGSG